MKRLIFGGVIVMLILSISSCSANNANDISSTRSVERTAKNESNSEVISPGAEKADNTESPTPRPEMAENAAMPTPRPGDTNNTVTHPSQPVENKSPEPKEPDVTTPTPENIPHPYAQALRKFLDNADGDTTAVLYDFDGDGVEEMILLEEGRNVTVYGIRNGELTMTVLEEQGIYWSAIAYVSSKNQLIINFSWAITGHEHLIYEYKNGSMELVANTFYIPEFDLDEIEEGYFIDGKETNEEQYNNRLHEL